MTGKKKHPWRKRIGLSFLILFVIIIAVYFIRPSLIVDFFHIGIDREGITLQEKKLNPREQLLLKWNSLVKAMKKTGSYPPFTFTSQELQIFVQEHYRRAFPPEIRGIETTLIDDELFLRIKVNLENYEEEIKQFGTPELARALKEDIVFTIRAAPKSVSNDEVEVDIRAFYFGFVPLPFKLIDGLINSPDNVKKYKRRFDYTRYPLPKGVKNLEIKDSVLYVNF